MTLCRVIRPNPFNPAALSLTGWWRAHYNGLPWAPTASAGTSGSNGNFVTAGSDPTNGSTLNGLACANFDGIAHLATNATDITSYATTSAATIIVLFQGDAQGAPTGSIYDDCAIIRDSNADFGLTYTTNGVTGMAYSGGYISKSVSCPTGAPHLVMMTIDGTNLSMTIDSAAAVTQACATSTVMTGNLIIGASYNSGTQRFLNGRIWEIMLANTKLTTGNYNDIKSYVNARYGLAL